MDVYSFINSTAMQNYLRNINYKFSGFEAAWLIYRSVRATLAEKHAAWQEIIDTWPDEESDMPHMPNKQFSKRYSRYKLHETLKEQIDFDNDLIKYITDNSELENKPFYIYNLKYEGVSHRSSCYFSSYELAYNDAKKHFGKGSKYSKVVISQLGLNDEYHDRYITISKSGEILDVATNTMFVNISAFENLFFEFPTPFKKGDILYNPYYWNNEPFVFLKALSTEEIRNELSSCYLNKYHPKNFASVYTTNETGIIELQNIGYCGEYTSFEYYDGNSDTRTDVLNVLSKHLNSDDDPDGVKFAQEYAQIIAKRWANELLK